MPGKERISIRIEVAGLARLEKVLELRAVNPKSRAGLIEEIVSLAERIFDPKDETILTTTPYLTAYRDQLREIADRLCVQSAKEAVADLYGEDIEAERSIDGRYFTLRRAGDTRTARLPSSRAELSRPNLEHVR